jgi:hypothetical protein
MSAVFRLSGCQVIRFPLGSRLWTLDPRQSFLPFAILHLLSFILAFVNARIRAHLLKLCVLSWQ